MKLSPLIVSYKISLVLEIQVPKKVRICAKYPDIEHTSEHFEDVKMVAIDADRRAEFVAVVFLFFGVFLGPQKKRGPPRPLFRVA